MTRINRAYVKRLENLILQLDATFSDIETARAKGYLARDMPSSTRRRTRSGLAAVRTMV
jgi:hypothetical protein